MNGFATESSTGPTRIATNPSQALNSWMRELILCLGAFPPLREPDVSAKQTESGKMSSKPRSTAFLSVVVMSL